MTDERVAEAAAAVVAAANRASGAAAAFRRNAERYADSARTQAARAYQDRCEAARSSQAREEADLRAKLLVQTGMLAPGWLSASWETAGAEPRPDILAAAEVVRCGRLGAVGAPLDMPLLAPLLNRGNLLLVAGPERRDAAGEQVQQVLLRALMGTGAGQLAVTAYAPLLSDELSVFAPVRQASEQVLTSPLSTPAGLKALLAELTGEVQRRGELLGGRPMDLGDLRREAGQPIEHYRLIVLTDYPHGVDAESHAQIMTLLRRGPSRGISFLVHLDPQAIAADGVDAGRLAEASAVVDLDRSTTTIAEGFHVGRDDPPSPAVLERALTVLAGAIRGAAAPQVGFLELQPPAAGWWTSSSADGLDAVIGRLGHLPLEITLGDEVEQRHNALVTGAVGQGKSNLLMALIHSWATRYSPDELALYLLDFKDGVTLFPLAAHGDAMDWLPHARVLGLESDRQFGLAVLDHLVGEFERRSLLIKPHGDNIARYRSAQPTAQMPRIVLVIDEFQVLFEVDDDTSQAALIALDRLARRGRAYGIHLVLASQTLSGITGMLAKQDGIFSQVPVRLALFNSAAESRAVLAPNNAEASRLRYRGEVVVNRDFGEPEANRRGVVAYADSDALRRLREALVAKDGARRRPIVFNGSHPASLDEVQLPSRPAAALGRRVDVGSTPFLASFESTSGRHLSIVGTGRPADGTGIDAPVAALQAAALSLAASAGGPAEFLLLDLLGPDDPNRRAVLDLGHRLEQSQHAVRTATTMIPAELAALEQAVADRGGTEARPKLFVIGFGLDRLAQARTIDFAVGSAPIDGLHAVWREGAQVGVHLLGWWANPRVHQNHVGLEAQGLIDVVLAFKMAPDYVTDLFGALVKWNGAENRALVRDVAQDTDPAVVVPFAASPASPAMQQTGVPS